MFIKRIWVHLDFLFVIITGTVSRLLIRSPETKSHLDVSVAEKHKKYYMGEGEGLPRIRAMVTLVNLRLLVSCLSTEGVLKSERTNLLVNLMQVQVSN